MRTPGFRSIFPLLAALPIIAAAIDAADARRHEPPSARQIEPTPARPGAKPGTNPQTNLPTPPVPEPAAHPADPAARFPEAEPLKIPDAALEPAGWDELDGWAGDDHASAFATFQASCRPMVRTRSVADMRPVRAALQGGCARAV